jgi:hypothetical protein
MKKMKVTTIAAIALIAIILTEIGAYAAGITLKTMENPNQHLPQHHLHLPYRL